MKRAPYPSDVTEGQWQEIEPLVPAAKSGGRPRTVDIREILNAIFYVVRGGIGWRAVPHDLPPWPTVYYYFWKWRNDGTWQSIHDTLRDRVRQADGREVSPSAAIIDSQKVHAADYQDGQGAWFLLAKMWAGSRYASLVGILKKHFECDLEIVKRSPETKGFEVLPHRWIVERTFGWLGRYRRLSKDYEAQTSSSEAMIYLAMTHLMLRRLRPA